MSFGVSVTDVLALSTLAWNIYKTCKESSHDFKRVSTEVASLHVILKETEEFLHEDNGLSETRRARLGMLIETSTDVLNDLKRQLSSYETLGTHSQRTWDRLRWGLEDIADVRSRLISVNTTLTAFNSSLTNSSQARIEKKLEKFLAEVRAGLREDSVVSSHHPPSLDKAESWKELQRELEDIGLSAGMVEEHQEYIKAWFQEAISSGLLGEVTQSKAAFHDGESNDSSDLGRRRIDHSSLASTILNDSWGSSEPSDLISAQTTLVDRTPPNEIEPPVPKAKIIRSRTLPQDIDALLSHNDPPFPDLPPPTRSDTSASHSPAALLRKKSIPSMLLFRLFQNGTKLIEAASDGSLERVANILSLGANVNVRDKWGWSALSMAAYGGHEKIAKLLLACGAETDTPDVDGDTPLDLATNRGYADVVIAIEEERANRVARGAPGPYMGSIGALRKSITKPALAKSSSSSISTNDPRSSKPPLPTITTMTNPADPDPLSRKDTMEALRPVSRSRTSKGPNDIDNSLSMMMKKDEGASGFIRLLQRTRTMEFGPLKKMPTFKMRGGG